ncbi:MAG: hypothetical protein WC683_07395 [bacterium]
MNAQYVCAECGTAFWSRTANRHAKRNFCSTGCRVAYARAHPDVYRSKPQKDLLALMADNLPPLRRECRISWCYENTVRGCGIGGCSRKVPV